MPFVSDAQRRWGHTAEGVKALGGKAKVAEWDRATKGKRLPLRKKKKPTLVVNNKLKEYGNEQGGRIEINVKKHKGNKAELADTIHHELLHKKHPKATEKVIRKKTKIDMSNMSYAEKEALTKKLRHKKLNYKIGAIRRHLKIQPGNVEPGNKSSMSKERLSILGLI